MHTQHRVGDVHVMCTHSEVHVCIASSPDPILS